ncbi:MAG: immunoglobulin domain-containing protein [Draconibacterium sp.]|nr:immunoglobulin domain-containing protein [Draconibacterium sp.]
MKIKNLFIAIAISLFISNTVFAQNAGVPLSEYNSLKELYENTNGPGWANNTNWLDTTNHSVADWFGITVENNHVTKIELSNNNLQEGIFETRFLLPELKVLDLNENFIEDANFGNLDSLSNLEVLKIENNKFIFKHIRDISFLSIYNNFSSNFTYSPQAQIDVAEEIYVNKGDLIEMNVSTWYLSTKDQFQWYKDGVAIVGKTSASFEITNATTDDEGTYYLKITNPDVSGLTLQSFDKIVTITDFVAGVPKKEYEALVEFYNSLDGDNWKNKENWLDTIIHDINDWYGITVEGGHVTQVYFDHNYLKGRLPNKLGDLTYLKTVHLTYCGLIGSIPVELKNLSKLVYINLSSNQLGAEFVDGVANPERQIPDELSELNSLTYLNIEFNNFMFNDLEAVYSWSNFDNLQYLYRGQYPIFGGNNNILAEPDSTVTFTLKNYLPGESDKYQWYGNNGVIEEATDSSLKLLNVQLSYEGTYYCIITNPVANKTTIMGNRNYLKVNDIHGAGVPLAEYNALAEFYNSTNGDNWKNNTNWLDTINYSVSNWAGIQVIDSHVYMIHMDTNNVVGILPNALADLKYLEILSLVNNNITGNLPDNIGELSSLSTLSLNQNYLTGEIPASITQMESLYYLGFSNNNMDGIIPSEIGNNTNLEGISLSNNNFSGNIPESIGNLSKLRSLWLDHNELSGTIPASIGNLTDLRTLFLNNNQLIGPLPVELENLTKLNRIDIDNNLIGDINYDGKSATLKSLTVDNNRQIPDELAYLNNMDTLYLGNNNLQFNDIEAIFSWNNFNDFKDFIYYPQGLIGTEIIIEKTETESVTLSIENHYPGNSDSYEWYKNGALLANSNSKTLTISNLKPSHSGKYHCVVTNSVATELSLTSKEITLTVNETDNNYNVPVSEYNALKAFYDGLGGNYWMNKTNWLDTVNATVNDWHGVTVNDGHITRIELYSNRLSGELPYALTELDSLTVLNLNNNYIQGMLNNWIGELSSLKELNLSENELYGLINFQLSNIEGLESLKLSKNKFNGEIPDWLENLNNLSQFHIENNNYTNRFLEPVFSWDNYNNFKYGFKYSPQENVGEEKTLSVILGDTLTIEIKDYVPGEADVFQWYKDNVSLASETQSKIERMQVANADSGIYYCKITNTIATDLILNSESITVKISGTAAGAGIPLSEYLALVEIYNSTNGNAWTNNLNWLDTITVTVNDWYGVTVENGYVSKFEMPNNNLSKIPITLKDLTELKKANFSSGNFSGEIPNLENLASLDEFSIANNNFIFNNLNPITDWINYNNFKNSFNYSPQTGVGETESLIFYLGDSINLEVENYISANTDNFEWFRNEISIQNGGKYNLEKEACFDDNNAVFFCEITNNLLPNLTLISGNINVKVNYSSNDSLALINLRNEYEILQEIWTNDSVCTWSNITFENGFVTTIDLSGLNMEGVISPIFSQFDSLVWLNLSNNNFSGEIPLFSNTKNGNINSISNSKILTYLNIANNNFRFIDLETNASDFLNIDIFIYAPQQTIGQPLDTFIYKYDIITFEIENYIPGSSDVYAWFKDGQEVNGKNDLTFSIENAALQDSGYYTCSITNSLFADLTLHSDTSWLKVLVPVGINNQKLSEFKVYPNPAQNRVFIDTKNETIDLKIFNLTGNLILEKNNTQSEWIDIKQFTSGVYVFRAIRKNSETVNIKVIFR